MKNNLVIIGSDDWEGLFVNGKLVEESHTLNQGLSRIKYLKQICEQYSVTLDDIVEGQVTQDYYDDVLSVFGNYPDDLSDVVWYTEE